ncbi:MAG: PBP1A family penicillin-binding protein [Alphaproteobacteria bacterium]|nr:PBP1A family penicillin-binding protein [Alphaproteobacteria bacterium]
MAKLAKSKTRPRRTKRPAAGQPRRRRPMVARRLLKWGLIIAIWGALGTSALVGWYAYDLPPLGDVPALKRRPAVTLLAGDGTVFARFGEATAKPVTVKDLPPYLPAAVLAVEDARFYRHFGIDLLALARAMVANIMAGRIVQGGSTITQQLAKNLFLGPERTVKRKVQEVILALWLEKRFTKDEILALYLNRVYLGAGNFGMEAAARSYFSKPARRLQLNEAAMLAGLLKAPSRYAPTRNRGRAARRAAIVLDRMVATGAITRAQARVVKRNPARLGRQRVRLARYFADWALDQARGYVGAGRGDLMVRTTLNIRLQRIAERATARLLAGPGRKRGVGQVAVVVLGTDGAIRAMVGGADYGKSQFNRAAQALRQPGSAFKPFVYLAGLESGLTPDSVMDDAPVAIGGFRPRNYADRYHGPVTLTEALAGSYNSVAVRVIQHAGIDRTIGWARRLGITSPLRREAGLALGASEVTVLEMAQAYAAFANGGNAVFAHGLTMIHDASGRAVYRRKGSGPGIRIPPAMLGDLNRMMAAVLKRGTGRKARLDRPAGAKTGTTQGYRDAWFIGYSADFVTAVWMGNDDGRPMNKVTGAGLPARLWKEVMTAAHEGRPAKRLPGSKAAEGFWSRLFGGGVVDSGGTESDYPQ